VGEQPTRKKVEMFVEKKTEPENPPNIMIHLSADEVAEAIDDYVKLHGIEYRGPRTVYVGVGLNKQTCLPATIVLDPSGGDLVFRKTKFNPVPSEKPEAVHKAPPVDPGLWTYQITELKGTVLTRYFHGRRELGYLVQDDIGNSWFVHGDDISPEETLMFLAVQHRDRYRDPNKPAITPISITKKQFMEEIKKLYSIGELVDPLYFFLELFEFLSKKEG
jgi:hypothetical protein